MKPVILLMSVPGNKQTTDFPIIAANYLSKTLNVKFHAFTNYKYKNTKSGGIMGFGGTIDKVPLYLVSHGLSDRMGYFTSENKLALELDRRNLNKTNVSKIILVACSTGQKVNNIPSFANVFARAMEIPVFAANDTLFVEFEETRKSGQKILIPTGFHIKKVPLKVIDGIGLKEFSSKREAYSTPKVV